MIVPPRASNAMLPGSGTAVIEMVPPCKVGVNGAATPSGSRSEKNPFEFVGVIRNVPIWLVGTVKLTVNSPALLNVGRFASAKLLETVNRSNPALNVFVSTTGDVVNKGVEYIPVGAPMVPTDGKSTEEMEPVNVSAAKLTVKESTKGTAARSIVGLSVNK